MPHCDSPQVTKQGHDESQPARQKYECTVCRKRFDDLTGTIFAGHHQPLRVWMLCLYFMGLNLSNEQIAQELDLNSDDAQKMTTQLREGIIERKPKATLSGEVECKYSVNPWLRVVTRLSLFRLRRTIIHRAEMDRRHDWLMFIRLCSIRYGLTEYLQWNATKSM